MFDPAYSQLLDTNQELRNEFRDEISINKSNEKKLRSLVKELEQCYRTISLQDNTIIVHEKENQKYLICENSLGFYNRIKNSKMRLGLFKMAES